MTNIEDVDLVKVIDQLNEISWPSSADIKKTRKSLKHASHHGTEFFNMVMKRNLDSLIHECVISCSDCRQSDKIIKILNDLDNAILVNLAIRIKNELVRVK